ncbi:MBOAT family O-acyltransferase [Niveispirillum irakense]|uniref:MBOAT family O-acyltransferase n=1 Tax=Niveispirillum irakense TaxID=34011 RepID=UPI00041AF22C|nr:MBOAT family O-acyltransferase [Niveispirillum irakense]
MLFHHYEFFIFLAAFTPIFALTRGNVRLGWTTLASLFFYAWWYPPYALLIVVFVLMAWAGVRAVRRWPSLLPAIIIITLLPLAAFKYTHFLLSVVDGLLGTEWTLPPWTLPLGVSFVTFTIVSLILDSRRDKAAQPPSLLAISVYVTFFPHLIAGPILRGHQMFPQLSGMRIDRTAVIPALYLFTAGIVKKVVIADPLAVYVDAAYLKADILGTAEAMLAVLAFMVQIYCDFSAYSDMAIALAMLFGVTFPENFRSPYLATSLTELWRRWHITLTLWLRDYVFMPLFRRLRGSLPSMAIFLTMVVSGIWHGAAWHFILWGAAHGAVLVIEHWTGFSRSAQNGRLWLRISGVLYTCIFFALTATMFRAPTMGIAGDMVLAFFGKNGWGLAPAGWPLLLGLCATALILHGLDTRDRITGLAAIIPAWIAAPICLSIIATCSLVASSQPASFYYFDF